MSEKRKRDAHHVLDENVKNNKKTKRGFTIGPQNLPDGTHRRKTQKIKANLIQNAKIKKNYAKLKRQTNISDGHKDDAIPVPATQDPLYVSDKEDEPSTSPHPDRQALMTKDSPSPEANEKVPKPKGQHHRKPKHQPFQHEYSEAQKRKAEAEERRKAREEADRQRQEKVEERERFRKAMAKARTGGKNGQRKLGRESKVLLERVKRMTANG